MPLWAIAATRFRGLADGPSCSECLQSDPAIAVAETVKDQLVVKHSLERGRHAALVLESFKESGRISFCTLH